MAEQGELASPPVWFLHVLKHCSWETRAQVNQLNKQWHTNLSGGVHYWRFMCERVSEEQQLYLPPDMLLATPDPKALFFQLWGIRDMWKGSCSNMLPRLSRPRSTSVVVS
eukprot:5805984-Pyramimonas_sp.AAC.2